MSEPFKGGQKPSLFPILNNGLEDRATSIFLAIFDCIIPFRDSLLRSIGQKAYKGGNDISIILRPSIGGRLTQKDIPDALLTLDQHRLWRALIEVKIGSNSLNQTQLAQYLNRAITEQVDALITISNEMCSSPEHPPLRLKPAEKRLRKIPHFHWSWRYILSKAKALINSAELTELEHVLLNQFIGYLENEKSGIEGYTSMPVCWPGFVDTLRDGGKPSDEDIDEVIAGWFQESADLALILSDKLGQDVTIIEDTKSLELKREQAEQLLNSGGDLTVKFELENGQYINVLVDINSRCLKFETAHQPTDRVKTSYKQIEKFVDVFRDRHNQGEWGSHANVRLFAWWKRQRTVTDASMSEVFLDVEEDTLKSSKLIMPEKILSLIIIQYTPSGAPKYIRSRKKMIEFLENEIRFFAETYVDI